MKGSKKSTLWSYVFSKKLWIALFIMATLAVLGFYSFYLYTKYANDRNAVRPYYDDEKKQLKSQYNTLGLVLVIIWIVIAIFSLFASRVHLSGGEGQIIIYIVGAVAIGFAWMIDRLAAMIAGKPAEFEIKK